MDTVWVFALLVFLSPALGQNVIDVIGNLGLTRFGQYLEDFGVSQEWADIPAINVFAPTDEAFQAAQDAGLLPMESEELRELLVYHAVSGSEYGSLTTDNFQNDALLESTYPRNFIRTNVYETPSETMYTTTGSKVDSTKRNYNASNGIVQVILTVMIPPVYNIYDMIQNDAKFSQLARAINLTSAAAILQGPGNFTLFAPNDDAFAKLPQDDLDALFDDTDALTDLLNYHLVTGTYYAEAIYDGLTLTTVQGNDIEITIIIDGIPGPAINGDSRILQTNLLALNGVVHEINAVLIPPTDSGAMSGLLQRDVLCVSLALMSVYKLLF